MKKILFFIFFVITTVNYSQEKTINLSLSSGISTPTSNFSDNSYAFNGSFSNLLEAIIFQK